MNGNTTLCMDRSKTLISLMMYCSTSVFAGNLTDTINISKTYDTGYQSKIRDYESQVIEKKLPQSDLFPKLDISASSSKKTVTTDNSDTVTRTPSTVSLKVSAPIFDTKIFTNLKLADKGALSIKYAQKAYNNDHTLKVASQYFATLNAVEDAHTQYTAFHEYKKSYDETKEMYKAGLKTEVDKLVNKASLDLSIINVVDAKNTLLNQIRDLEKTTNRHESSLKGLPESVPHLPDENYENLLNHALHDSARAIISQLSVQKAKIELDVAYTSFFPKVSLSVDASQELGDIFDKDNHTVTTSLTASVNAFSGMKDKRTIEQKKLSYLSSEDAHTNEYDNIQLDMKKAFENYESAKLRAQAGLSALVSARLSLEATQEQHNAGSATELEVLAAITQSMNARKSFYASNYALLEAYLNLHKTAGTLSEKHIHFVNSLLTEDVALVEEKGLSLPTASLSNGAHHLIEHHVSHM